MYRTLIRAPLPARADTDPRFACVKAFKRPFIRDMVTGEFLYTPPDFIRLTSREPMNELAAKACTYGKLRIEDIIALEVVARPRKRTPFGH